MLKPEPLQPKTKTECPCSSCACTSFRVFYLSEEAGGSEYIYEYHLYCNQCHAEYVIQ